MADNGGAESIDGRIKLIKVRSRGFRNTERFRNAIYFHLGDLDLHPEAAKAWKLPTRSEVELTTHNASTTKSACSSPHHKRLRTWSPGCRFCGGFPYIKTVRCDSLPQSCPICI